MHPLLGCAILLLIAAAVIIATVLAIAWMRKDAARSRGSGTLGNALQELEGLFVESKRTVIEAERRDEADEDESGEPPEKQVPAPRNGAAQDSS